MGLSIAPHPDGHTRWGRLEHSGAADANALSQSTGRPLCARRQLWGQSRRGADALALHSTTD